MWIQLGSVFSEVEWKVNHQVRKLLFAFLDMLTRCTLYLPVRGTCFQNQVVYLSALWEVCKDSI